MFNRRHFLARSATFAATALTTAAAPWAARAAQPTGKRLVVILLRGAVDGLNVVVPYQEDDYYEGRPKIAIPQPGQDKGGLDLDSQFALHPALSPLMPLWQQGSLAFVQACGSPDATRSHFDAQDFMESGTPGVKRTADGWMNRLMTSLSGRTPIQAVSVGATTPRILSGYGPVANVSFGKLAALPPMAIDEGPIGAAFDRLYAGSDGLPPAMHQRLNQAYQEGRAARSALIADFMAEMQQANNGAPLPVNFVSDAQRLAQLMQKDSRVELAFMALGGWDTHVNQGASQGPLAKNLDLLGRGLAALVQGLGPVYQDTTIVVMSEFGRTVRENGNGGTDHGHGNLMWLLGGPIRGGKVYGQWPGLAVADRYEGRDLAVTTDFRDVLTPILAQHLRLSDPQLSRVLPNFKPQRQLALLR
jgi:uncharacterized protein (DUF1501 family)